MKDNPEQWKRKLGKVSAAWDNLMKSTIKKDIHRTAVWRRTMSEYRMANCVLRTRALVKCLGELTANGSFDNDAINLFDQRLIEIQNDPRTLVIAKSFHRELQPTTDA